ncbi:ATP-binding cassette domain-containing protein [Thermoactinospora rubra]|uniref:ATP-binding cassette domain-containing protein n=1 Tax=Thermoactinospora rubra TaxID=1088767 RepID=UPI000A0FA455|nr:ATP-binding cassette domain-containing protein [Thermoactinospora rubra]
MSHETWAIETRGLVKVFGAHRAVGGVDLSVPAGCVYSVLGPNGAGKTTLIRMIATLLRPDGGTARVLGHDVTTEAARVRARLALTGQFASLDEDLTGLENLTLLARLRGHRGRAAGKRAGDLLEAFSLSEAAKRAVKTYSGGMRRRLDIAASLVVRPDLLILDEPTTGLDPRSRGQVWQSVRALVDAGATVLLTTQYLEEADQLADRIAVLDHGRVIAEGTSSRLKALAGAAALRVRVADRDDRPEAARLLAALLGADPVLEPDPVALTLRVDEPAAAAKALAAVTERGLRIDEYALAHPSLDEVFLALTGKPADGPAPRHEEVPA